MSGIETMYRKRGKGGNFGPPTYTSQEFLQKIAVAAGLDRSTRPVRVLDSMSGPGLVGTGLQRLTSKHRYYYLNLVADQLAKVNNAEGRVVGDARQMPFRKGAFRIGVVRYGAKDIREEEKNGLFQKMYDVTARRGRWILADMYAPTVGDAIRDGQIYEWLNWQHAMKQERSGRNRATEGTCHIPTEEGWLNLFRCAGFKAAVIDHHMSYVTTTDWLKSNQVTPQQLEELNQIILTAPEAARRAFNIREENGLVKIDYPVTIIRAVKP